MNKQNQNKIKTKSKQNLKRDQHKLFLNTFAYKHVTYLKDDQSVAIGNADNYIKTTKPKAHAVSGIEHKNWPLLLGIIFQQKPCCWLAT